MSELTYRPGLEGVIAGETAISTIAGGLRYRGFPVEILAEHASFEEVAYLIWHGQLPNAEQLQGLRQRITGAMQLPAPLQQILQQIPPHAPLMDAMRTGCSLLAHWDDEVESSDAEANLRKSERLLAQLPLVMAAVHRFRQQQAPLEIDPRLPFAANVLRLVTGKDPSPIATQAMNVSLILYAEHEFNASTFAARVVCSTWSDLHSAVTAAIGALKGPLHGGANERVMQVLQQINSPDHAHQWVHDALARKERIMGFGHRVYKTGDPRAQFLKPLCQQLARDTGNEEFETIAEILEQTIRQEKGLPPNLDWPSARLYYYLGLPVDLYTPLFVVSRIVGWTSHVMEQAASNRIIRPRSQYVGPEEQAWIPLEQRNG